MKACVVSIGCDKYQNQELPDLSAAENDATAIYEALVNSEYALYDKTDSVCLRSPKLAEIIKALEEVLFERECPDVLTIFFAGHGGVFAGTYYLCLNETRIDRISLTALPLSEIFRIVSSSQLKHVNLVIDACYTAGLVNDLLALIKPDLIGARGSFGLSILAAAASDEIATEIGEHGILTKSLLRIINGKESVNTYSEYLDLVSIGRTLSTKFIEENVGQTPSSWGINLYGPSIFSKNPFHSAANSIPINYFSFIPSASRVGKILSEHKSDLLELYENLEKVEGVDDFINILRIIIRKIETIGDQITIVKGIGYRFIEKFQPAENFKQLELINALITLLIPSIENAQVKNLISELIQLFRFIGNKLLVRINSELQKDKYFLISREGIGFGMLANYFYLPIRISKIIGYLSQLLMIDNEEKDSIIWLIDFIKVNYESHISTMSDLQAPFIYTFFRTFLITNEFDTAKPLLYRYINSYLASSGKIAPIKLSAEKIPLFLIQRYTSDKISQELRANPTTIGTVLLLQAIHYGLDGELDLHMHSLDRKNMHIFIPCDAKEFGNDVIENGMNLVPKCGFDFFTCEEFKALFEINYNQYSNIDRSSIDLISKFSFIAASFCLPDRIPLMY